MASLVVFHDEHMGRISNQGKKKSRLVSTFLDDLILQTGTMLSSTLA